MTVKLSQKEYFQLLKATRGHPDKIFDSDSDIFMEDALMAHKAKCTIHTGVRCDCHPEIEGTNRMA